MKELIGIVIGLLTFFLLVSLCVSNYGRTPSAQRKITGTHVTRLPAPEKTQSLAPTPVPPVASSAAVAAAAAAATPLVSAAVPAAGAATPHEPAHTPTSSPPPAGTSDPALGSLSESKTSLGVTMTSDHADAMIEFQTGCAHISRRGQTTLKALLSALTRTPHSQVEIRGYTDNSGHQQFNEDLSRLRADVVRYYLMTRGIEAARIRTSGHGPKSPIADNRTPTGRQRNRRVQVTLHDSALRSTR